MTKRLFLLLGVFIGFLLAELLRRQKMERLAALEAKVAEEKARFAEYDRQWRQELANMPFEERMEYELWEAKMRLDNWMPADDEDDEEDDDNDAET